jgi:hypothetical protein
MDPKVGDRVTRMLAGQIPMELEIVALDDDFIYCGGGWKFDRARGYEVDEELGWGKQPDGSIRTGSFLVR